MKTLRILFPFLLAVVLNLSPRAVALDSALKTAATFKTVDAAKTVDALRQVALLDPWREGVWEKIAEGEMAAGNAAGAIAAYQEAVRQNPLSPSSLAQMGKAYFLAGDEPEALEIWQSLIQKRTASLDVYRQCADLQRARGDYSGSRATLSAWMEVNPLDASVRFRLGMLLAIEQPEAALSLLLDAERMDPHLASQVSPLRRGINAAVFSQDAAYQKLVIGRALADLEQWDLAVYTFIQAVTLSPGYAEAWAFLGEAYQHTGRDGLAELQRASTLNPDSILVKTLLALYWRRQGKPAEALPYLYAVIAAEPQQPLWRLEAGSALAQAGDVPLALTFYQQAVDLEPNNAVYWRMLAEFCGANDIQVQSTGFPAARQALLLAPQDPAALDVMGWLLLSQGDLDSAERFLLRALQADDTYAAAHLHLGQVYLQQRKNHQASIQLTLAFELAPKDSDIARLAQRLIQLNFNP